MSPSAESRRPINRRSSSSSKFRHDETVERLSALLTELDTLEGDALCHDLHALITKYKVCQEHKNQSSSALLNLLSPHSIMHILSMLSARDIVRLTAVSKFFYSPPSRTWQTQTVTESVLLEKGKATGLLPPQLSFFSRPWLQRLDRVEAMLTQTCLAPGRYILETTAVPDIAPDYFYKADGEMVLLEDGSVTGFSSEDSVQNAAMPLVPSRVEGGTYTVTTMQFRYRYGTSEYAYTLQLESVTKNNNDGSRGLVVAELTGRWVLVPHDPDPRNNGNVQSMLLRGPLFDDD